MISIIIPHYNTPELLVRCLRSIPVRPDVQVIVVDDCSPGREHYLAQIPELSRPYLEFYITPQGGSAGRARNVGLQHARGQWCLFADADDYYQEEFLKVIEPQLTDDDLDILYFNVAGTGERAQQRRQLFDLYLRHADDTHVRYHVWEPWNKVIARRLIEEHQLRFDETRYANDVMFGVKVSQAASRYKIIADPLYVLTDNEGSLSYSHNDFGRECIYASVRMRVTRFLTPLGLQYKFGYCPISLARIKRLREQFGLVCCLQYVRLVSRDFGLIAAISYYRKRKQYEREHPDLIYSD